MTSQHDVEAPIQPYSDDAPAYETQTFEADLEAQAEAAHQEVVEAVQEPEFQETVAEYEPEEEASASFRVDPAGTSEFRQSAPEEDLAEVAFEDVEEHESAPADVAAPAHEFTSVQATGEMISDAAAVEPVQHLPSPAAPIEHEGAVQSVNLSHAEQTLAAIVEPLAPVEAGMFAPGDGELEEELMDDDEGELPALRASAYEDDLEEETLEGAADLGTMLREMSIDQITRPEDPVGEDEDDDFDIDEEDIEEDAFESDEEGDDSVSGSEVSEAEEEEFAEEGSFDEAASVEGAVGGESAATSSAGADSQRRGRRDGRDGRRGGRDRGGREGGRSREGSSSRESGSREGSGSRDRRGMAGSRSGGRGRQTVQASDLPAISDLLKPGQEVLVQIAKEPIAKKSCVATCGSC